MTSKPCPKCGHDLTKDEDSRLRCKTCRYSEQKKDEQVRPFGRENWTPESEA